MGHTKPDILNNLGRRHVELLFCLVKYCEYSKDDRLKFHAHPGPYDAKTMRSLAQAQFQCYSHSTSVHIGYLGHHSVVSFTSNTQESLSISTA